MFATQLLRILQTIPADVNYETWDFDASEVKLTMKENQNEILCHSNAFEREADPLEFQMEDGRDPLNASVPKCSEVVDRRTDSDDDKGRNSVMAEDQERPLCHSNGCQSGLELSGHKDKLWSNPKFERSIIVDSFINRGEKESGDSETLCTTGSPFVSELDSHIYTDKNVQECELSKVIVCYKESNYQIIKDICVDEGLPTQDKTLIEAGKDGHVDLFVSQPCDENKHTGTTKGCHDTEPCPDGLKVSTVDVTNSVSIERGTKEEVDVATFFLDGAKSSLEDYAGKDATEILDLGNLTQMGEANLSTNERTADDVSEDESAISSGHSLQESIVQDSILLSSDCDGNEAPKQLDEVRSLESILESVAVAFTTDDSKKNCTDNNLHYNSKVESGTITFDFKSTKPAVDSHVDGSAENSHKESIKSAKPAVDSHVDGSAENSHKESIKLEDVPNHRHENLNDHSAATVVEYGSRMDKNESVLDPKTQSQDAVDHPSQVYRGGAESSFSSSGPLSGLITYSGPIAYSGSISLRSDSSTTSTRSFAFPVLQPEWNSSPVRMTKADRRHIRKHRGWRQGLFCCRF